MDNNQITLIGSLFSDFTYSHEVCGEIFYSCRISVERDSGTKDILPVIVSERLIDIRHQYRMPVYVVGNIRSHSLQQNEKKHLLVYVFASEFTEVPDNNNVNEITMEAAICKQPQIRTTPLGRFVADLMLVCKRSYNKYDFIPCICWGRDAVYASSLSVGEEISLAGRFQSREYVKTVDGNPVTKTAYEVSISHLHVIDPDSTAKEENVFSLRTD